MANTAYINNLIEAYDKGDNKLLLDIIGTGEDCWNWGLAYSCLVGHKELASFMLENGANRYDWGLSDACAGGHKEIVELMIEKGAKDWDWGLGCAHQHNHKELILLMLEHGADIDKYRLELDIVDLENLIKKDVMIGINSVYFRDSVFIIQKNTMITAILSCKLPWDLVRVYDLY